MNNAEFQLRGVGDPRLAVHATSAFPAWLWSTDGTRILWANPVGARLFGAATGAALAEKIFSPADPHRRQVAQLAERLPLSGAIRLERLRGFGALLGQLVTCGCARLAFAGDEDGILVAAAETVGRVEVAIDSGRMVLQRVGRGGDIALVASIRPDATLAARASQVAATLPEIAAMTEPQPEPLSSAEDRPPPGDQQPAISGEAAAGLASIDDGNAPPAPRHPLRFTWQIDDEGRFSIDPGEFTGLIGARAAAAGLGRLWSEIAETFELDPDGRLLRALATRDTWSGITLNWPADGGGRLPVELSGLPVYDRMRNFAGYRGFGVCRDLDGLTRLAALRRCGLLGDDPALQMLAADVVRSGRAKNSPAADPPAETNVASRETPEPVAVVTSHQTDLETPVETPKNVVPFRPAGEAKSPILTSVENSTFDELARQLAARLDVEGGEVHAAPTPSETPAPVADPPIEPQAPELVPHSEWLAPPEPPARGETRRDKTLLDLLPIGVLIYRLDRLIYANTAFLERIGYSNLHALEQAGGLDALYVEAGVSSASSTSDTGTPVTISTGQTTPEPAAQAGTEARLYTISWDGNSALALIFSAAPVESPAVAAAIPEPSAAAEPPAAGLGSIEEIGPFLNTKSESELREVRRRADRAATAKADMLARISHEVRSPLNAIIGFAEVMIGERFGALGNERYLEYLKDIRASGERVIAVINDLQDLSRIETGKLDLAFANQDLNELVEQCVAAMQPQANRERIIIRSSLAHALPAVVADSRALRQIALNLIGNSIHLANAGGQVIVSTALTDFGEVILRVRDTGQRLNDNEVAAAMEPFLSNAPADQATDSGFSLSLTKALVEANRAQFHIRNGPRSGTLIEVVFARAVARA